MNIIGAWNGQLDQKIDRKFYFLISGVIFTKVIFKISYFVKKGVE